MLSDLTGLTSNEETQEVRTLGAAVWFQAEHDEYERW